MIDLSKLPEDARKRVDEFIKAFGNENEWEKFQELKPYIHDIYKLWVSNKHKVKPDVGEASRLCAEYSPLWTYIMIKDPESTGGFVSLAFTPFPHETEGFAEIYPLDISIYAVRLDSLRFPENEMELKKFFASLHSDPAFKKFPRATAKFVFSGMRNKIKAKLMPWKEPKWKKVLRGEE